MAAWHRDAVIGHAALAPALTDVEALQEQPLHTRGEMVLVVIAFEGAAPTQQVRETHLVSRGCEASIRGPAVTDQDAVEVRARIAAALSKPRPGWYE
jgi:hypothetical protein